MPVVPFPARRPGAAAPPLRSFWMAGFEGADHVNMHGDGLDMVAISGHAEALEADHARLAAQGLRVARESIGWRLSERAGRFDFSRALAMARAAERQGVQILWTLMHYGTPADVSLLDDGFIDRFAAYAGAAAQALRPLHDEPPVYTPINEISFLAWAACETNLFHPYIGDRRDPRHVPLPNGFEVKRRLVRATLEAMRAIRAEDPRARFLHVDPLVHVVAPCDSTPELAEEAARFREFQWQAWDMLAGRSEADLGGSAEALDLVGINHYVTAQWEFATGATLAWPDGDARRLPLHVLLREAADRYGRPLLIAETGHVGEGRALWLDEVEREVSIALAQGTPLRGVCLYPIVDRPDWNNLSHWHRCGLWDESPPSGPPLAAGSRRGAGRCIDLDFAAALARCTRRPEPASHITQRPVLSTSP